MDSSLNKSVIDSQLVVGGSNKKYENYLNAREKAFLLETELDDAQKEYIKKMVDMLKVMQKQFHTKYGEKIKDLEDIEESISFVQHKGLKDLKRKLQSLYLESLDSDDQENFRQKSKLLRDEFQKMYYPKDRYQEKRDKEASYLQQAIMGSSNLLLQDDENI